MTEGKKSAPPPTERDIYNVAFTNTLHKLNEIFYRNNFYLNLKNTKEVIYIYEKMRDNYLEKILDNNLEGAGELGVRYKPKTREELVKDCRAALKRLLAVIIRNRLYGRYANAEVDLKLYLKEYDIALFGKIDIATIPSESRIVLADLKSELNKDYVNPDQLKWYALLWYYKFVHYPTELLFIPLRGKDEIVQVDTSPEELKDLMGSILGVRDQIKADRKFAPRVNAKCWSCPEKNICLLSPYAQKHIAKKELAEKGEFFSFSEDGQNHFSDMFEE